MLDQFVVCFRMEADSHRFESFARTAKGFISIDAFNLPAPKFFKPALRFGKPQFFRTGFDLIIESGDQTLSKLHAVSQRKLYRIRVS